MTLTKQSSENEIKEYFTAVMSLSKSDEEFPVNLDDVWPLVYSRRDKAISSLRSNDLFMEGVDYQVLHQKVEKSTILLPQKVEQDKNNNTWGGNNKVTYMLSVPCLEFFIARKVRPVFEVYRQVFHKVANGELLPSPIVAKPTDLVNTLTPLADFHDTICERFEEVVKASEGNESVKAAYIRCETYYDAYRKLLSELCFVEAVREVEGDYAIQ